MALTLALPAANAPASTAQVSLGNFVGVSDAAGLTDSMIATRISANQLRISDTAGVTAGPGCTAESSTSVVCQIIILRPDLYKQSDLMFDADLGPGDDSIVISDSTPPGLRTLVYPDGGDGNDTITIDATSNPDVPDGADVDGGPGDDSITMTAAPANDTVGYTAIGGTGNDTIVLRELPSGQGPVEPLRCGGNEGNDTCIGGDGPDSFSGNEGNDRFSGGNGDDGCFGYQQNDRCKMGAGDDRCGGGPGNDVCIGGPGDDKISGGRAVKDHDRCIGGPGFDTARKVCDVKRSIERTVFSICSNGSDSCLFRSLPVSGAVLPWAER